MNPKDFQCEKAYFDEVAEIIRTNIKDLNENKSNMRRKIVEERKKMWEENRHVVRDFDDAVELTVVDQNILDAELQFERNEIELQRMERMLKQPYFGRIDFTGGSGRTREVYIGLHGLAKEDPHRIYVVDWRAPAASMFYTYDLGPAQYETPSGMRDVELVLKRQYEVEDGKLIYAYDTDSSMHDSILGEVLSQSTDNKLRVIIGSIQKEQNEAIRSRADRNCLIYGLAGSGKTSVGLHRLAYILYRNRDTMTSDKIVIISNNGVYSSYVASILPELGERPVETLVFSDLLSEGTDGRFRFESLYEQLHRLDKEETDPAAEEMLKWKYSLDLLQYFIRYFSNFTYRIPDIHYRGALIFSEQIFREKWVKSGNLSFKSKYEKIKELIVNYIEDYFSMNREMICRDLVESHEDFVMKDEIPGLFRKAVRRCKEYAVSEFARLNQPDPEILLIDALDSFFMSIGKETNAAIDISAAIHRKKLLHEDALLYLLVRVLMGKIPVNPDIQHIVIDEAQDYSLIQLYIIKSLFPKSTFTILADIHQTVNPFTTIRDYGMFEEIFGSDIVKICLEKCYRSSSNINALAFQLIDSVEDPIRKTYSYFDRPVKKPQYIHAKDMYAEAASQLEMMKKYNTAAIITSGVDEAVKLARYLKKHSSEDVQLIASSEERITNRLVIIPLLFAKGLEFDMVLLFNFVGSLMNKPDFRQKVYLGCTRALHELYFLEEAEFPKALEDCSTYLDIVRDDR